MANVEKMSKGTEKILAELYSKASGLQDKFESIKNEIYTLVKDPNIKDLCSAPETIERVSNIISEIQSLTSDIADIISTITSYYELLVTCAMEIILKMIEVLKLDCKRMVAFMKIQLAKFTKEELLRLLDGEGTAAVVTISAPIAAKAATAQIISKIVMALDLVVSSLSVIPLLFVDGCTMCFFPTPKSIMKMVSVVKMTIVNPGNSLGNTLGDIIEPQISNVIESFNVALGSEKTIKIAAAAAQGAATVTSETGIVLLPVGILKKIDINEIMKLVNSLLALLTIGVAEPLPRYEKLNIINLRYLIFLITGFVPAGFQAFGIPSFP